MAGEVMDTFLFILLMSNIFLGVGHFIFDNTDKATFYIAVSILIRMAME